MFYKAKHQRKTNSYQRKGKAKKIRMCVKDKSYVVTLKGSSWDPAIQNSPWKLFSKVSCM